MRKRTLVSLLTLMFVLPAAFRAHSIDSTTEQEVWQMEELYWKNVQAGDVNAYMKRGTRISWAGPEIGTPLADFKCSIRLFGQRWQRPTVAGYKFLSKAVRLTGNVGITQYAVESERLGKDGKSEKFTSRITHTWLKSDGNWRIIGGMSAPLEPSGHTW
jgi:ketosteroid isomerase-like protein